MKTKSEIFKLAHRIAKEIKLEGNYSIRLSLALKAAYNISKLWHKMSAQTTIEFHTDGTARLYNGANSFGWETRINSIFLGSLIEFPETESQRFTRLAVEAYNKSKVA